MNIYEKIIEYLRKHLDSAKYKHSLGVAQTAKALARRYGVDEEDAYIAGLLHDIGRTVKLHNYKSYLKKNSSKVGRYKKFCADNPFLLHGMVGADIAKNEFGIKNKKILDSIFWHTVANRRMSDLEKVIYVSDMIAPDRRSPYVKRLKKTAFKDLERAFIESLGLKIEKVLRKKRQIFPETVAAWNEAVKKF